MFQTHSRPAGRRCQRTKVDGIEGEQAGRLLEERDEHTAENASVCRQRRGGAVSRHSARSQYTFCVRSPSKDYIERVSIITT